MAKLDAANKTGGEGGRGKKLTAVDDIVLDIVGRATPVLKGISDNLESKLGKPNVVHCAVCIGYQDVCFYCR